MGAAEEPVEGFDKPRVEIEADEIENAELAANYLGIPPSASDDQIEVAYRELTTSLHPDIGGTVESFQALSFAQELLKEFPPEAAREASDYRAWRADKDRLSPQEISRAQQVGELGRFVSQGTATRQRDVEPTQPPEDEGPGPYGSTSTNRSQSKSRGFGAEDFGGYYEQARQKKEQFEATKEAVKLTFIEQVLNIDLEGYSTVAEAIKDGVIARGDIERTESVLQDAYGIPTLELDDVAGVIASMVVTGAVDLGEGPFSAEGTGVFGGTGSGAFGSGTGAFGGSGTGVFK